MAHLFKQLMKGDEEDCASESPYRITDMKFIEDGADVEVQFTVVIYGENGDVHQRIKQATCFAGPIDRKAITDEIFGLIKPTADKRTRCANK